ncbi:MAG: YIP1 family protein [Humidesulfovibrio sp.]|nr:hypothetical protein [Desulfovibrio sp.]MDO9083705.1 YIP1 family protein [Humidesulfovibrio sp.]
MRILCPMCGFGREIDEAKIPQRAQMATCPRCEHKFRFRVVDDLPPADPRPGDTAPRGNGQNRSTGFGAPGAAPAGPDPLAAQRASAAEAWKRIQGVKDDTPKPEAASAPQGQSQELGQEPGQPGAAPRTEPQPDQSGQYLGPESTGSPVPFEDLPRVGFFPGLWSTIRQVLTAPSVFFQTMPVSGGMAKPLIFHLLLAEFMLLCQYLWGLTSLGSLSQYAGSPELMDMGLGMAGAGPILILVFYPLLLILRLMLMTGVIHLLLRVLFRFTGGQGSGAEATFRVLCYCAAPLVLGVIPFFGPLLGGIWSIALTIIGLKEAHRTRGSVAMFAVLVPILMMLAAVLGVIQSGLKG